MYNFFLFHEPPKKEQFILSQSSKEYIPEKEFKISRNLEENIDYIRKKFDVPKNNDIVIRNIMLKGNRKGTVIFIDGMTNSQYVNDHIIETLLFIPMMSDNEIKIKKEEIMEKYIAHGQAVATDKIEDILEEINFGSCAVFIDGIDIAFTMDVRYWVNRGIQKPDNEQSIYGPQESFGEMLRTNSALIRKILKTEKLICEGVKIGNISKTRGVLMYINDIANESLINEVKRRINSINVDYIISIEEVGMFVEDNMFSITNQVLSTERPDRAARFLTEGRVVLLLNGSPNALVFPTNALELTHAASDAYMKPLFANAARFIRLLAMFISAFLPGLYLALTLFHEEMIPTYLLYAISAARENVPFSSIVELFLMDFSFEMIREAGIRMPGTLGSTLGIVGGLIIGQAAVSAKIVSPIMIIIISLTAIGSFATANYSLGWSFRIMRLIFVVLGATFGFYGIGIGIFLYAVYLASLSNFGINFLSPVSDNMLKKSLFTVPVWDKEKKPEYLKQKNVISESKISRGWLFRKGGK